MKDYEKNIEIPFGANDSELCGFEYTIPEGYEAKIKDGKVIVRKTESEDARIRKRIIALVNAHGQGMYKDEMLVWLEKQGQVKESPISQHENKTCKENDDSLTSEDERIRKFLIQMAQNGHEGNKGWWNKCVAWLEKQGEQKPADKVETKFKVGDIIKHNKVNAICKVISVNSGSYYIENIETNGRIKLFNAEQNFHLWTIQDAKDGDVLNSPAHRLIWIYKDNEHYHVCVNMNYVTENVATDGLISIPNDAYPATNDERTILLSNLEKSGYKWDAEKKELNKIEQQPVWSEEDEIFFKTALWHISYSVSNGKSTDFHCDTTNWLKSLKDRVQPQPQWKPSEEQLGALWDSIKHNLHLHPVLKSLYNDIKKLSKE